MPTFWWSTLPRCSCRSWSTPSKGLVHDSCVGTIQSWCNTTGGASVCGRSPTSSGRWVVCHWKLCVTISRGNGHRAIHPRPEVRGTLSPGVGREGAGKSGSPEGGLASAGEASMAREGLSGCGAGARQPGHSGVGSRATFSPHVVKIWLSFMHPPCGCHVQPQCVCSTLHHGHGDVEDGGDVGDVETWIPAQLLDIIMWHEETGGEGVGVEFVR